MASNSLPSVLLIEDSLSLNLLYQDFLRHEKIQLNHVAEGSSALKFIDQHIPEIHELAGDFSFGDASLYFWQAFLKTPALRKQALNSFLVSRAFKIIFFGAIKARLLQQNRDSGKLEEFNNIVRENKCSGSVIALTGIALFFIAIAFKVPMFLYRAIKKINSDMFTHNIIRLCCRKRIQI